MSHYVIATHTVRRRRVAGTSYHIVSRVTLLFFFFFFNDTATTEIYTLSLHDALPIYRKSTRLNSSHGSISYAVSGVQTCALQIGRAHVLTPVTVASRMPYST